MNDSTRKPVTLIWVTNPDAAQRIVEAGSKIAAERSTEIMIVSIQNPIEDNWSEIIKGLEKLNDAARAADAELTVVYSDNRLESAVKLVRDVEPAQMVAGIPGNLGLNPFLEYLQGYFTEIPIYTVSPSGKTAKLLN